jgi:signal transduction histidine kinase
LRRRLRFFLASYRLQLLWWFVAVLAAATIASVLLVRVVLFQRVDARVDAELRQEVEEIRRLAGGTDPATSQPFGDDVRRIFDVFLDRNIPNRSEWLVTFIGGQPYRTSGDAGGTIDPEAFASPWASITDTERGRTDTPAGVVDYLAVPFRAGGRPEGVFVVAILTDEVRADAEAATVAAAGVGLVMLILGSLLAGRLADRILRPVAVVTRTARSISESDLTRRIPVTGHDEISDLAGTFNAMLSRLEAAFATQRRFLDAAGHELRTPITIIRGHLEVMGDDPTERQKTMAIVEEEFDRISRLIDDLLTLARADRPGFIRPQPTDIADLTHRIVEKARGLDGNRDWRLEGVARADGEVDGQRLTEAVLQLAENAARYADEGTAVEIGSAIEGNELRFWVRDGGPGIPIAERERIFDRFERGSTSRRTEGSGLGLSIVRVIAEAHGGTVRLTDASGAGSRFEIAIPLRFAVAT